MQCLRTCLLITLVTAGQVVARQSSKDAASPSTNSLPTASAAPNLHNSNEKTETASRAVVEVDKKTSVGKTAAQQAEARRPKKFWLVPLNALKAVNPLAPTDAKEAPATVAGESPRAWTTTVGWHPGASAFPDPTTHESKLSLITVSGARKP